MLGSTLNVASVSALTFFFSSRRRHTRYWRDWSSDVCSSDLKPIDGRYHGTAIGCYFEGGASGPREHARLVLESDGTVSVHVGSSANGQGLETAFAQIAADALEIPMARIRGVFHGSTDLLPQGFGTYSSRSIVIGGSAILASAAKLREIIRGAAAPPFG